MNSTLNADRADADGELDDPADPADKAGLFPRVRPVPGRPLYLTVRDAVLGVIDGGGFADGERVPSTQQLGRAMGVSLVTAHRAMQELVGDGVLRRSQGRGTFVDGRYRQRAGRQAVGRVGLVFHRESSMADYYHGQVLEGVRQAAEKRHVDLILLRFGEDYRNECGGYLYVNPLPEELAGVAHRGRPAVVVGADPDDAADPTADGSPGEAPPHVASADTDNVDLGRRAAGHLLGLGHRRLGYVGGDDRTSNNRDRWRGFSAALDSAGHPPGAAHVVKAESWRLGTPGAAALDRALASPDRPTAIFAAGYDLALDVYAAADRVGLRVPDDLSVVGVDDPPSAAFLNPPLTTFRQRLGDVGSAALDLLYERLPPPEGLDGAAHKPAPAGPPADDRRTLKAEMIVRRSSAAPTQGASEPPRRRRA